ncbi:Cytochrome P450 2U1 [Holothuria leucospilota]|uniref:Cytochrome P450 2U1 n=1 Tax=Holothuria leucospilota TaxID=206669 RepID=A0A9Q0YPP8_HOLLE|nr:Cytochrome P450 2U1 [Holothuria leucospilota]
MAPAHSSHQRDDQKILPPGTRNPFTILRIPKSPPIQLTNLSRRYGPLFTFRFPIVGSLVVVLNNHTVIHEALVDNSDAFPNRVTSPLRHKWGIKGRIVYSYKEEHKIIRQFVLDGMKKYYAGKLHEKVAEEARHFCTAVEEKNGKAFDPGFPLTLATGNINAMLNFGRRYEYSDPNLTKFMEAIDYLHVKLIPSALVQKHPGLYDTFLYRKLKESQEFVVNFICDHIREHRATLDPAIPRDLIDMYLMRVDEENSSENPLFVDERGWFTIKDVITSSSLPSAASLQWVIALLCKHQEMQEKIYEELQAAVGNDRLPEFNDLHKMPFTHAFLTEILRYRTVLPVVSREVVRDVIIDGHTIPQGSNVLINYWAAERDPAVWEKPDDFVPERFLSSDGKTLIKQDSTHALGIGHRDCMGKELAMMQMFLFGTTLLQKFHLKFSPHKKPPSMQGITKTVVVVGKFEVCATKR